MVGDARGTKEHLGNLPQACLLRAAVDRLKHQAQLVALLRGQAPVGRNGATDERAPEPLDLLKTIERIGVEQHEGGQRRVWLHPVKDEKLDVSSTLPEAQMEAIECSDRAIEIKRCRGFSDRKLRVHRYERQHAAMALGRPEDELIHPGARRPRREIAAPSGAG